MPFRLNFPREKYTPELDSRLSYICGPCKSPQANNGSVLTKWFRRFEEGGERPRSQSAPPLAELCLRDNCLLSEGIYIHTCIYSDSKENGKKVWMVLSHTATHTGQNKYCVSDCIRYVSHRSHICTAVESAKAIHSSQSFTFHFNRTIAFSKSILFVQKKVILFARKKRICNNFGFFYINIMLQ